VNAWWRCDPGERRDVIAAGQGRSAKQADVLVIGRVRRNGGDGRPSSMPLVWAVTRLVDRAGEGRTRGGGGEGGQAGLPDRIADRRGPGRAMAAAIVVVAEDADAFRVGGHAPHHLAELGAGPGR